LNKKAKQEAGVTFEKNAIRTKTREANMVSLGSCKTCGKEVSTEAKYCPHCGQPDPIPSPEPEARKTVTDPKLGDGPMFQAQPTTVTKKKYRNSPIFLTLSVIAFVLSLGTPRFLLFFPLMTTLGFAAVSIFRREKGQIGAVIVLVLTGGLFLLSEMGSGTAFKTTETQGEAYDGAGCTTDKLKLKISNGTLETVTAPSELRRLSITVKSQLVCRPSLLHVTAVETL
jgi:hypothetical protein